MRTVVATLLIGLATLASAQSRDATSAPASVKSSVKTGKARPAKTVPTEPDAVERTLAWLRKTGLAQSAMGRATVERLVASMPKRFSGLRSEVAAMQKRALTSFDAMGLDERRRNLLQLWKLRGSIDLLALLEPNTLHALTGLDVATLTDLSKRLVAIRTSLGIK